MKIVIELDDDQYAILKARCAVCGTTPREEMLGAVVYDQEFEGGMDMPNGLDLDDYKEFKGTDYEDFLEVIERRRIYNEAFKKALKRRGYELTPEGEKDYLYEIPEGYE